MDESVENVIRRQSAPLEPLPTGAEAEIQFLPDIRAVLFDIYGTLFISGSGEVGTADASGHAAAFCDATRAVEIELKCPGLHGVARLHYGVAEAHAAARKRGIEHPEVDIVDVWSKTLAALFADGLISHAFRDEDSLQELAAHYEVRANPAWPMSGASACLAELRKADVLLGIVSNAQFFTPPLFPALLSAEAEELGFHRRLQFYSYRFGRAKPGKFLYERAAEELKGLGVEPRSILFVGNDMLNDVAAAASVGFRTALFAGDARSLRRRTGDERIAGVAADIVLTNLDQLPGCVVAAERGLPAAV